MRITLSTKQLYDSEQVQYMLNFLSNIYYAIEQIPHRNCHDSKGHYESYHEGEGKEEYLFCPVELGHALLTRNSDTGKMIRRFLKGRTATALEKLEGIVKTAVEEDSKGKVPFMDIEDYRNTKKLR